MIYKSKYIYISTVSCMILFTHSHTQVSICTQWIKGFNMIHTPDHKLNRLIISDKYYSLHNQDYLDINYCNLLLMGWSCIVSIIFVNYGELMTRHRSCRLLQYASEKFCFLFLDRSWQNQEAQFWQPVTCLLSERLLHYLSAGATFSPRP